MGRQFAALQLQPGDRVSFDARVMRYRKDYRGDREEGEYCLKWPTRMYKMNSGRVLPLFAGLNGRSKR